jgi:tetratricopeptide (TPR) repeat protein
MATKSIYIVLLLGLIAACRREPEPANTAAMKPMYVDSAQCAGCHAGIAESYKQTGMGRSFFRPSPANRIEDYSTAGAFYHAASDRYYTMTERDGRYFVRRHQRTAGGEMVNVIEQSIDYVIGSGNHVRSYLHLTPQRKLIEMPVSWYAEKGGRWDMSPGYDWQHHSDFRRKITMECVFCHNGYPDSKQDSDRSDMEAVFPGSIPEGIDCQRCHGPGSAHVNAPDAGNIVNPARLSRDRNLEVCMQCHLESTSAPLPYALRRFGRGVFSYAPGEPLADYMLHFDTADDSGNDRFEIASAAYRLRLSRCFRESDSMTCTTCHDPHRIPRGEAAASHYVGKCLECHETAIHQAVAAKEHPESRDCLGCHMPKRRTGDVVHAVMTDHYIQRKKAARDLLAPLAEPHGAKEHSYKGEVIPYYPRQLENASDAELYNAVAQVTAKANLQLGAQRLQAAVDRHQPREAGFYFELAKAYSEMNLTQQALAMYQKALERQPDYWPALHRLGLEFSRSGNPQRALELIGRAAELSTDGTVLNDLALVYRRLGRPAEAVAVLQRAVARDDSLPHVYNNLGGMLMDSGDVSGAEQAFRAAIRVQPDLQAAYLNLRMLLQRR